MVDDNLGDAGLCRGADYAKAEYECRLKWSSGLAHRVMSRLGVMVVGVLGSVE